MTLRLHEDELLLRIKLTSEDQKYIANYLFLDTWMVMQLLSLLFLFLSHSA